MPTPGTSISTATCGAATECVRWSSFTRRVGRFCATATSLLLNTTATLSAELDRLGYAVVPGVLARWEKADSLELRRRLEQFLDKHDRGVPPP